MHTIPITDIDDAPLLQALPNFRPGTSIGPGRRTTRNNGLPGHRTHKGRAPVRHTILVNVDGVDQPMTLRRYALLGPRQRKHMLALRRADQLARGKRA